MGHHFQWAQPNTGGMERGRELRDPGLAWGQGLLWGLLPLLLSPQPPGETEDGVPIAEEESSAQVPVTQAALLLL